MYRFSRTFLLLAAATPFLTTGCGETVTRGERLSGRVTIDGAPVTAGNVLLISEDGRLTATAPLRGDGAYVVQEPPLGRVKIAVETLLYRDRTPPENGEHPEKSGGPRGSAGMVLPDPKERGLAYRSIPEKYERVETSGLTVVVERGVQQFDIALTEK
jgi:hypothetical protein